MRQTNAKPNHKANTGLVDPQERFKSVAEKYHVETPTQVQLRLLWTHIMWLVEANCDPRTSGPMLNLHRTEWTVAEMEQVRLDREKQKK